MKSLVIGKNGLIARKIAEKIYQKQKNQSDFLFTSSNKVSLDKKTIFLDLNNPNDFDYSIVKKFSNIIMLGGISSPDECENNPKKTKEINYYGTKFFIEKCLKLNAKVLFFSTDLVYGNSKSVFNEDSIVNPECNYSFWKNNIEKTFINNNNFKVFRLSYVLSIEDKFLTYLHNCRLNNSIAEVFHPFYRNVIFIDDVIDATFNAFNSWEITNQINNVCGNESISRKDIAESILSGGQIKVIDPGEAFWKIRPKIIHVESIYLKDILKKKLTSFDETINKLKKL